jgi:phosphodiesterase/alkaline phosphatase D-like protein
MRHKPAWTRRDLLRALATLPLATAPCAGAAAPATPSLPRDPFSLGVASGYPRPDGMVLWTRLAPEPLAPAGGMPPVSVPVRWEVARDPGFRQIAAAGTEERIRAAMRENPHIHYATGEHRGYLRLTVTPGRLTADLRGVASVHERDARCATIASFVVEDGIPGPKPT